MPEGVPGAGRGWNRPAVAVVLLTACWLIATLTWPFGWDQGIFAWVASVIRDGGLPYRDAVDLKGPLPYYVFAVTQTVLGDNTWGIRVVDAAAMIAAAGALAVLMVRLASPAAAIWAGCALVLWMGSLGFWGTAQPDGWAAVLMTGSMATLFGTTTRAGPWRVAAAAALAGSTALVKPFYLVFALIPLLYPWVAALHGAGATATSSARRRILETVLPLLAAAMPAGLAIGWFAWHGALDAALDVHIRYSAESYAGLSSYSAVGRIRGLIDIASRVPALVLASPAILVGVIAAWKRDRELTSAMIGWLLLAVVFVALQGRFYRYQMLPAFPPLAAFATLGFTAILGAEPRVSSALRVFVLATLALVLVQLVRVPAHDTARAAAYITGLISEERYYRGFSPMPSFNAADQRAMARTLAERSDPGDRVAVLGYNAGILYLAGRRSASRFGLSYPFTHETNTPLAARFQQEFLHTISAEPPEWILVGAIDGARLSLERRLRSHPGLAAIVAEHYCREIEIGHYVLFRRCDAAGNSTEP